MKLGGALPSADALVDEAAAAVGVAPRSLSPTSREALGALLDGYAQAPLTRMGRLLAHGVLATAMARWLRLDADLAAAPDVARRRLEAPVVIASPFRTGTTLLQRLLAQHPALRWLSPCETAYAPPPLAEGAARVDDRRDRLVRSLAGIGARSPDIFRLHPVAPDEPDECFALLETSFVSPSFAFHGAPPGYAELLDALPRSAWASTYTTFANQLRCMDEAAQRVGREPRRYLLKSASHLDGLGALLDELPDARVIQLHRDPLPCVTSLARLYAAHHALYYATVDPIAIGRLALTTTRAALGRAALARSTFGGGAFLDLAFDDLVADPTAVALRALRFVGLRVDDAVTSRLRAYAAAHPPPRPTPGAGTAATFGLDREEVAAAFAKYDGFAGFG